MSSGSYRQADVQCPFYHFDDGRRRITCEGILDESTIAQSYRSRADFETQLAVFCCRRYVNCEIYRLLLEKYEDA